jgi:protein FRG1
LFICLDAIGMREHFEPVFENGNVALSASNDKFIRFNDEGDLVAMDDSATEANFIQVRSNAQRILEKDKRQKELPAEEQGTILETELNYVKKFQKFQDKKIRIHQGDVKDLVEAKQTGSLHEALLDRREKMKADRYCK